MSKVECKETVWVWLAWSTTQHSPQSVLCKPTEGARLSLAHTHRLLCPLLSPHTKVGLSEQKIEAGASLYCHCWALWWPSFIELYQYRARFSLLPPPPHPAHRLYHWCLNRHRFNACCQRQTAWREKSSRDTRAKPPAPAMSYGLVSHGSSHGLHSLACSFLCSSVKCTPDISFITHLWRQQIKTILFGFLGMSSPFWVASTFYARTGY